MRISIALALSILASGAALADTSRVTSRAEFVALVQDRALRTGGIRLTVAPGGTIDGRAYGFRVTGTWTWNDGYFCREMKAGPQSLPLDCQVVQRRGDTLRFTAQKGKGDVADLRIQ